MTGIWLLLGLAGVVLAGSAGDDVAPVAAGTVEKPTLVETEGTDQRLIEDVRTIVKDVERIRGERFRRPPLAARAPLPVHDVAAQLRAHDVLDPARLAARGRAWRDIGLGDVEAPASLVLALARDLEGVTFDPSTGWGAGGTVSGAGRILVAPDRLSPIDFVPSDEDDPDANVLMLTGVRPDEPLVGHVLMHVLQLEREGRDSLDAMTDRMIAREMWGEGEANLVAVRLLFEGMGMADEVLSLPMDPRDLLEGQLVPSSMDRLPAVEGALLEFVYLEGYAQAAEAYGEGGFAALDRAMSRRTTTAQILHRRDVDPSREVFTAKPAQPREGLALVDTDSIGEQGVVVLVSTLTGKDNLGLIAGDGWAGDRLYRWEPATDPRAAAGITVWVSRWASEDAAADLVYALRRTFEARFPGIAPETTDSGELRLTAAGRLYRLSRTGAEVTFRIEPAP